MIRPTRKHHRGEGGISNLRVIVLDINRLKNSPADI
jgi:hypothetical protein